MGREPASRHAGRSRAAASLVPTILGSLLGVLGGLGSFTFGYGQGASYLSNRPTACTNCHAMQESYDTWQSSGHRHVAVCNDCHLPHGVRKWITKADNGFFHSLAFTTGDYPWPLQIKPRNARVTQQACIDCHRQTVHNMMPARQDRPAPSCVGCHAAAGHAHHSRRGAGYNR